MILDAMADEAIRPRRLRRCWAADSQTRIHSLQRLGGHIIQVVVCLFFRIARPEVDIRFVPDFKIPLRDFVDSVPFDKMPRQMGDEFAPLLIVGRRRNDRLVPERIENNLRSTLARNKAQFYEGTHAVLQQSVINLIYVGKIVDWSAARIFSIYADFVVENCVESDVFKVGSTFHVTQVAAVRIAETQNCPPRAEHLLPIVRKWMRRGRWINDNCFFECGLLGGGLRGLLGCFSAKANRSEC